MKDGAVSLTFKQNKEKHLFRYSESTGMASVSYPNGTSSQTDERSRIGSEDFLDYITQVLGELLPKNTLTVFKYLFRKNVQAGHSDFIIDYDYLAATTISDDEQKAFHELATQLDEQYFQKTGRRFNLNEFHSLTRSRYRIDIENKLRQFRTEVAAS